MRNLRQNAIRLATAATLALSGVAAIPAAASANDVVGEIKHTLICWEKLVTNAPDRVPVCNPVLHVSSFSSQKAAPQPEPDPCLDKRSLYDCCYISVGSFSTFAEIDYPCAQ